jgi:23S rRNA (guanosine2251-2'-O)-methyltransferase
MSAHTSFIFGPHPILEAIVAGKTIDKLFIDHTAKDPIYQQIRKVAWQRHIPCSRVPTAKLNKMVTKNHQGVVALLSPVPIVTLSHIIQTTYEAGQLPLVVILDSVTDVGNLGAIIRTALCVGAHALVLPLQGSASLGGAAMKTSAGALAHLPICREPHLGNTLTYLQQSGLQVVACHEKAAQTIYQVSLKGPLAIVLGSEERGIHPSLLQQASQQVSIPMQGPLQALNVSAAAAIILYEVFRQRHC